MVTAYDNEEQDILEVVKENNALRKNNEKLTKLNESLTEANRNLNYSLMNITSLYKHYRFLAEGDKYDGIE